MEPGDQFEQSADAWLRAARPRPDRAFVEQLEDRLFPSPQPRRSFVFRPAFAGGLLAGGLAAVAVILGLAGGGPLGSGDHAGQAQSNCHFVAVRQHVRVPVLVQKADGPHIVYQQRVETRNVKRCR